ncbi:hypothetical protein I5L79_13720 [Hymenobacter sp. BT594]|uniref:CpXC domain-containing protein n=2 Tax=Hymenobacter guriensis TaxID=2793065 RepID=A0ABS0L3C6_9BACT|nr:hypothetical protein [Hymenobacter guriensis]
MRFSTNSCFLCGAPAQAPQDTVPVLAPWLLDRYQLSKRQMRLLDQSVVAYEELRIPCCPQCRLQAVEPLEAHMAEVANGGLTAWQQMNEQQLFLWLGKMFYGILLTELLTELDPLIKPQYPLSENGQMLGKLQSFYQVFQALRVPIVFEDFTPASVFILEVDPAEDTIPFEYDDDLSTMMFSIKLDNVVLVACLLDNGIIRQAMRRVYEDVQGKALHPVQVAEFKARVYYAAYLFNVVPDYYVRPVKPGDQQLVYDTLIDDVTREIFNPWENSGYAQSLQEMWKRWRLELPEIMRNPAQPLSFLYDEEGMPRTIVSYPEPT